MSIQLPDHPQEARLRHHEREFADTIEALVKKTATALRSHNRTEAVTLLTQIGSSSELFRRGLAKAIDEQMQQAKRGR